MKDDKPKPSASTQLNELLALFLRNILGAVERAEDRSATARTHADMYLAACNGLLVNMGEDDRTKAQEVMNEGSETIREAFKNRHGAVPSADAGSAKPKPPTGSAKPEPPTGNAKPRKTARP